MQVEGTPLYGTATLDSFELVRTIAATRIVMPASVVRLSAGRTQMNDELQALCFHAGANSIFLGDKLLVTPNPGDSHDHDLLRRIDMDLHAVEVHAAETDPLVP
jgi:biotin synthase